MLVRVSRHGEFDLEAVEGLPTQCGAVGITKYRWSMTIEATDHYLSPEGYIIDNYDLYAYFMDRWHGQKADGTSCENVAIGAVNHFRLLFDTRDDLLEVEIRRIYCRIEGVPPTGPTLSFIEAEWKAPLKRKRVKRTKIIAPVFKAMAATAFKGVQAPVFKRKVA